MQFERLLLTLIIIAIPLGNFSKIPLGFINLPSVNLYLNDLLIPLLLFIWLTRKLSVEKRLELPPFFGLIILFTAISGLSLLNGFRWIGISEFLVSGLYWVRWTSYAFLYPITYSLVKESRVTGYGLQVVNCLIKAVLFFSILGFFQYIFFPDFSKYIMHGWDPHYYRLLSTFFDPNFAGILLTLGFILVICKAIYTPNRKRIGLIFLAIILVVGVILTFSRSSYLALVCAILLIGLLKSRRLLLLFLIISLMAYLFMPRVQVRVNGALEFDETVRYRLDDWSKTWTIIGDHWLTGVGFNAFRYAQERYYYFRSQSGLEFSSGHAGAGADSSLLFVWATTGIFGLVTYLVLYGGIWLESVLRFKKLKGQSVLDQVETRSGNSKLSSLPSILHLTLIISIPTLFVHSQFVNSLFYPWIMIWMWIVTGLALSSY